MILYFFARNCHYKVLSVWILQSFAAATKEFRPMVQIQNDFYRPPADLDYEEQQPIETVYRRPIETVYQRPIETVYRRPVPYQRPVETTYDEPVATAYQPRPVEMRTARPAQKQVVNQLKDVQKPTVRRTTGYFD